MGFWIFLEPKKIWNDPDPKRIRIEDVGHHLFVEGFSLQNVGGHPTLNIILWRWPPPFCSDSDRCFSLHGGHGFCRKEILVSWEGIPFYREKTFCSTECWWPAPPMEFQGGSSKYFCPNFDVDIRSSRGFPHMTFLTAWVFSSSPQFFPGERWWNSPHIYRVYQGRPQKPMEKWRNMGDISPLKMKETRGFQW